MELVIGKKIDRKSVVQGVWYQVSKNQSVLLAKLNNANAIRRRGELLDEYLATEKEEPAGEHEFEINLRVFVETVLLNWRGVYDVDGKSIEYSPEVMIEQIGDDLEGFYELYGAWIQEIMKFAQDAENYTVKRAKKTAKKSRRRKRSPANTVKRT